MVITRMECFECHEAIEGYASTPEMLREVVARAVEAMSSHMLSKCKSKPQLDEIGEGIMNPLTNGDTR